MKKYSFAIFADYFQVICQDELSSLDASHWNETDFERRLIMGDDYFVFITEINMDVPVEIEIHPEKPHLQENCYPLKRECQIHLPSGKFVIRGGTDYFPIAPRIALTAGVYNVMIFFGGLETVSATGLESDEHYKIILYPVAQKN